MRPLRFLLLLAFFVVLPIFLTCFSLLAGTKSASDSLHAGYQTRTSRLRALLSFTTPSSIFPPSALISLTDDNSTFFLARPAAFGPSLPSHSLSGQLWVGKGFGEDTLLSEEELKVSGFELGCSDVPGWSEQNKKKPENGAVDAVPYSKIAVDVKDKSEAHSKPSKRNESPNADVLEESSDDDGTDDYLHYPLPDSNPASSVKSGEPADVNMQDKSKQPTHADIESLQESADIAGKVAMLSRGGCGFLEKVKWAQRRGAIALIVGDNEPGQPLAIMYAKGDTSNVTIPSLFTSYTSAHLLSSLVPPEKESDPNGDKSKTTVGSKDAKSKSKNEKEKGPVFTSTRTVRSSKAQRTSASEGRNWVQNVLSAVGLDDDAQLHAEDSRRPPSSGNIDWVLLEDWDEEKPVTSSTKTLVQTSTKVPTGLTKAPKSKSTSTKKAGNDDFIIGVQDWRDTELIAPKPTKTAGSEGKEKGNTAEAALESSTSATTGPKATATALKGGSITPGSGEYDHQKADVKAGRKKEQDLTQDKPSKHSKDDDTENSLKDSVRSFLHFGNNEEDATEELVHTSHKISIPKKHDLPATGRPDDKKPKQREGLWVTLTPTSVSTSPFFDTLLVLVISPLVTLTFVYGLLLLRSRIRRRRWRAPKSIVERLPVRTYHTMSSTSSTTSSNVASPVHSSHTSPQLRPTASAASDISQVRPRSQTTPAVVNSPPEKDAQNTSSSSRPLQHQSKRKRYTGRQVECVVCLEDYIDGESRVMSLPCGHEFHVECITPWLVTRRRTCPICKGDVVRSFTRSNNTNSNSAGDNTEATASGGLYSSSTSTSMPFASSSASSSQVFPTREETSDDIQERAAATVNEDASAAIPIPVREVQEPSTNTNTTVSSSMMDEDVERGESVNTPLLHSSTNSHATTSGNGNHRSHARQTGSGGVWRGIWNASLSRLSGDTVWGGSTPSNDRTR